MSYRTHDYNGKDREILEPREEHKLAIIGYGILVATVVGLYIISFFI